MVTGVLLVGGASRRFGSPKALARFAGETLAERAWRTLGAVCDEVVAVGKAGDGIELPFPLVDDGTPVRAPLAGVVAGLRVARHDVCLVLPVDCPCITAATLCRLAASCADAAVPGNGPLPGAYARRVLPVLEHRLETGRLALHEALAELDVRTIAVEPAELANVNTRADLSALEP